jgi:hypothetical protein
MFWLLGNRLQSYIRHLRWTLWWSVPAWNLRDRRAKQYKRLRESRKSYRRQTVWGVPGWPCGSINLVASGVGGTKRLFGDGCSVGPATQAGITKVSRVIFLFSRSLSPNGVLSLSVA